MVNMTRASVVILLSAGLAAGVSGSAIAQQVGGPVAPPGSGNASKISSDNQQNNAGYNRLVGASDGVQKKGEGAASRHAAVAATPADIKPGSGLRDIKGVKIGTVVSVDATQAVVDTGQIKIGVPLVAFGKDDDGLLLGMTAAKFSDLVAKAKASN
jgi:hypothetical protein